VDSRFDLQSAGRAKQSGRCRTVKPSVICRTVNLACQPPNRLTRCLAVAQQRVSPYLREPPTYASRLRNSQVAKLSVKTAMMAIGQVLFKISRGGISFRNTPLVTTIMYRRGLA
jgi:hypothetical protein